MAGPAGQGGVGEKGPAKTIGKNNVVVPAVTWKVVMVLNAGAAPDRNTRLIAVVMPNDQTVDENWAKYRTSVKEVEKLTGYTFFGASAVGPLLDRSRRRRTTWPFRRHADRGNHATRPC